MDSIRPYMMLKMKAKLHERKQISYKDQTKK